jgi:3-dehydrosphinganine reductase
MTAPPRRRPGAGGHAIVTGGSSGIGEAIARRLAGRCTAVSLIARDRHRLAHAAAALTTPAGAVIDTAAVDVADAAALRGAVDRLMAAHGACDVLVTSAGIAHPGHFARLGTDIFRRQIEVNYLGTVHAVQAVAPAMIERRRGSIVTVASAACFLGIFGYSAYSPTKYAVRGFAECLRAELRPVGVDVACVFPPDVDTPQLAHEAALKPPETAAVTGSIKPLSADVVADAVIRGIDGRRFWIFPDPRTRALARSSGLFRGSIAAISDRRVAHTRRRTR